MTDPVRASAESRLEQLRDQGAHRYDPVRFCYLETQTQRLQGQPEGHHRYHERLAQAIEDFEEGFRSARSRAEALLEQTQTLSDSDQQALTSMLEEGELKSLMRRLEQLQRPSHSSLLAPLFQLLQRQTSEPAETIDDSPLDELWQILAESPALAATSQPQPRRELKALGELRAVQARQSMEQLIDQAIARTPADAGPMNPHRMVTRAIKQMRTLSPEYLYHFVGYVDTLITLEKLGRKG